VILESDSLLLVNATKEPTEDKSIIAGICHDIRELCMFFFEFTFVRREANSLADTCAKEVSLR
jgi:hypothetical protein